MHKSRALSSALALIVLAGALLSCAEPEPSPRAWIDFPRDGAAVPLDADVEIIAHAYAGEGVAELILSVDGVAYGREAPAEAGGLDVTIPADERLWVRIEGWESDAGDDDPMGAVQRSYGPAENWGGGTSMDWALSSGEGTSDEDCDEDLSPGIDNYWRMGFEARWQIARLH